MKEWGLFILVGIIVVGCLLALVFFSAIYYDDNGRWPWDSAKQVAVTEKVQKVEPLKRVSTSKSPVTFVRSASDLATNSATVKRPPMSADQLARLREAGQDPNGPVSKISGPTQK